MSDTKSITAALIIYPTIEIHTSTTLSNPRENQTTIGNLQYISLIQLNIVFALNKLSQFMHHPTSDHQNVIKQLLQYLCGTSYHGVVIYCNFSFSLHAFSYLGWASNKDDFTSISAYIIYLGHKPISWSSMKQNVIRFSTKAKYHFVAFNRLLEKAHSLRNRKDI